MRARGQAATELALGLTVMVTILTSALYFADLALVRLKTQEAATSAAWDLTALRIERQPNGDTLARIDGAVSEARARYADFDGRTRSPSLRTTGTLFTRQNGLALTAQAGAGVPLRPVGFLRSVYGDLQGVRVAASSEVRTEGLSRAFLEGARGLFAAPNLAGGTYTLRSMGPPGPANGQGLVLALGDWGLAGQSESDDCTMATCPSRNPAFTSLVQAAYDASGVDVVPGGASALGRAVWGAPLADEDRLWLSAPGEDRGFQEAPKNGPAGNHAHPDNQYATWTTTPGGRWPFTPGSAANRYADAWACRQERFLGGLGWSCP